MGNALGARFTTVLLAVLSLTLLAFGILNFEQQAYQLPTDGVSWLDTAEGVEAWIVAPDGPGYRAGIRKADRLRSIGGRRIERSTDAAREVFQTGVWSQVTYELDRHGRAYQTT